MRTKCLSLGRKSFGNVMPRVSHNTQASCREEIFFFYVIIKLPSSPRVCCGNGGSEDKRGRLEHLTWSGGEREGRGYLPSPSHSQTGLSAVPRQWDAAHDRWGGRGEAKRGFPAWSSPVQRNGASESVPTTSPPSGGGGVDGKGYVSMCGCPESSASLGRLVLAPVLAP